MVFPRIERWSRVCGFLPFTVSLTDFKCVFMLTSTPVRVARARENSEEEEEEKLVSRVTRTKQPENENSRTTPKKTKFAKMKSNGAYLK